MSGSRGSLESVRRPAAVGFLVLMMGVGGMAKARAGALDVKVGKARIIMREANYPALFKLADGSIYVDGQSRRKRESIVSTDGGRTWKPCPMTKAEVSHDGSRCVLSDGTALAFAYHTHPAKGKPDTFTGKMWVSTDHWKTVKASPITVHVPNVVKGYDDGGLSTPIVGPKFVGRAAPLKDGTVLATMDTFFVEDTKYPKVGAMYKWRSILVKSTDRGKHWEYVSTVACISRITDPKIRKNWQYGFCEPSLVALPDGKLICVMRTGTYVGTKTADSYSDLSLTIVTKGKYVVTSGEPCRPIYQATSTDGGKTWDEPRPVPGAHGARPRLALLANGVLAMAYGRLYRPTQKDAVIFSADGGKTWSDPTLIYEGLSSGYTGITATGPNKLLMVFDAVTAWGPKYAPDWIGAVDIEVKVK